MGMSMNARDGVHFRLVSGFERILPGLPNETNSGWGSRRPRDSE